MSTFYYTLKPFIPRGLQIVLRREMVMRKRRGVDEIWPIDREASEVPDGWPGWPGQKRFALVLQHDVDTQKGHDICYDLMALEQKMSFRSSFNFVPERYGISQSLCDVLRDSGFEVGVHGLKHDGKLFLSRKIFEERAVRINQYLKSWNATGFTSPSMHHNLEWMQDLAITHGTSTFDTDPFEPQPDGVKTIFPLWIRTNVKRHGYVELPYTIPQDFTLFVLMREKGIDIWKRKLDWIARHGGMALLNTHPDYMNFTGKKCGLEEYPASYYEEFLLYIRQTYSDQYWQALPRDIARFWREAMVTMKDRTNNPEA